MTQEQVDDALHSVDELLETALELFCELASDNLPAAEIERFNAQFNDCGLLTEQAPEEDWAADVGFVPTDAEYAEIWLGLGDEAQEFTHLFARLLLSRRVDEKFCHIEWLPA
ncbi:MAG: HI1450 family dsDNA-mimic protein [Aeromonas sp.]